jgi:ABC-type transport system involved in cytochrome c biogenesis permease subunit
VNDSIKRFLKPLASLRLTVALLVMAMILIFAGTLAQRDTSVWQVQKQLFHNGICWIPFKNIVFVNVPGSFPFIGGYTLIGLLLLNLLAAHTVRFKLTWKRSGVILIHAGLILLLLGELVTANFAKEGEIQLSDGQSTNYTQDIRKMELAVIDPTPIDYDAVTVVPDSRLKVGQTIGHKFLPFDIKVDEYFINSRPLGPMEDTGDANVMTTRAAPGGTPQRIVELASYSGAADADKVDIASALITVSEGSKTVGPFVVSGYSEPTEIEVAGKPYLLQLRLKRNYKPYTIHLIHFAHDKFVGSELARNFSSDVELIDPSNNVDRKQRIWMNHPLRYRGETFYQQSFSEAPGQTTTTTIQVVYNPGAWIPYAAVGIAALGMLIHFALHLIPFLRRRFTNTGLPASAGSKLAVQAVSPVWDSLLQNWKVYIPGVCLALVCLSIVIFLVIQTDSGERTGFDLYDFSKLPVNFDGRPMPLDTLARTALKLTHGSEILVTNEKTNQTVPPIQWLIDVMAKPEVGMNYPTFRIDNPDLLNAIGLDTTKKFFSLNDLLAQQTKVDKQLDLAMQARQNHTLETADLATKKAADLADHLSLFNRIRAQDDLFLVPPLEKGQDWKSAVDSFQSFQKTGDRNPALRNFLELIQDYAQGDVQQFNHTTADYLSLLNEKLPVLNRKDSFESFLNHFDPFFLCLFFYVLVFLLGIGSWLGWTKPLASAALMVLFVTWCVHTFGLVSRIYISGRPPVTNLYSSAVFIAWGAVLTAMVLEVLFRNGIGSVVGSALGFCSLLIAQVLSVQGDTMEQLRAVLDTNFWLWTHVPCVTIGYLATAAAGMLGLTYIVLGIFTKLLTPQVRKDMARMIYGVVCFAILFSFVGTILGGIWADQSWGRFWGWDPKENGAILIVLTNAILLHARWGGLVRTKGIMALGVFGNIIVSWSWFGTNMLGVGLHSYGFMEKAFPVLVGFVISQLLIIGLSFIPLRYWRSFADEFPSESITEKSTAINIDPILLR